MILLIAIATVGAIGIVGTGIQSAQARHFGDPDDTGHGQSSHDINGDINSNGHA
jgi:hypothetical protein